MRTTILALLLAIGCGGVMDPVSPCGGAPCGQCHPNTSSCAGNSECCSGLCVSALCVPAASTVTWSFTDECNAGQIDYGFFDDAAGVAWPSGTDIAYVAFFGQTYMQTISCKTGDQICIGGVDDTTRTIVFGVGIGDAPTCAFGYPCCFACTTTTYSLVLGSNCRLR